ncbi:ABC transporter permease [Blastopirellula marina]|uniref:ABC transporter permease n=1 Tax=Blastopirellula marina TaxID=124 RepID=A0A2S8FHS0_9BACT|nr:ABC transporter permease [Blastopirellula marina]PQO31620.1 ABC transporter permease [Blastopirellula marina]PTL42927.1 ABC transporter permease [Blastopirellula marina]
MSADQEPTKKSTKPTESLGFWATSWRYFRRRFLAMAALYYVIFLASVAIFSPAIVGTKPIVCYYKGNLYFPAMGYFYQPWENAIFTTGDHFDNKYEPNLKKNDPNSWAIWPLVRQDPIEPVGEDWFDGTPKNPSNAEGHPNWRNLFGTSSVGVDVFAQLVHGTRVALLVGFVSMGIASTIGIIVGAVSGYFGGWIDFVLSRFIEIVLCVPTLILVIALLAVVENPSIWQVVLVIGLTGWTSIARLTRAEFLKIRQIEYVAAAKAMGAGPMRIMFVHILRNALAPILVPITFGIAAAIFTESALSFLGIGADTQTPTWGRVLHEGQDHIRSMWWLNFFPGLAIFTTVLAYNLIGEGIQEATDPRTRDA